MGTEVEKRRKEKFLLKLVASGPKRERDGKKETNSENWFSRERNVGYSVNKIKSKNDIGQVLIFCLTIFPKFPKDEQNAWVKAEHLIFTENFLWYGTAMSPMGAGKSFSQVHPDGASMSKIIFLPNKPNFTSESGSLNR